MSAGDVAPMAVRADQGRLVVTQRPIPDRLASLRGEAAVACDGQRTGGRRSGDRLRLSATAVSRSATGSRTLP
jgi:hypothetical protein